MPTKESTVNYEQACEQATTDQGLDPVVSALREAGYMVEVAQTGGFTMVAEVYKDTRFEYPKLGITATDDSTDPLTYLVCEYSSPEDEGRMVADEVSAGEAVWVVRYWEVRP